MTNEFPKPEPAITPETKPFWDAAKNKDFMLVKCTECGTFRNPVSITGNICPECGSRKPGEWVKASGKGKVHTYTAVHRTFHPAFEKELPYILVIVELDEGPRYLANMREAEPGDMKLDMPVEVIFEKLTDDIMLPQFRPAK
ncbi:MAG: Zn-ribbon domain-containing OB-fold protein [Desulfobacterales bacterium]